MTLLTNKSGESSLIALIVFVVSAFILIGTFSIGYTTGTHSAEATWQREAVKQNKAEWVTDENGEPLWQWKGHGP